MLLSSSRNIIKGGRVLLPKFLPESGALRDLCDSVSSPHLAIRQKSSIAAQTITFFSVPSDYTSSSEYFPQKIQPIIHVKDRHFELERDETSPFSPTATDESTNFLLRLLENVHDGKSTGMEKVTTARCNATILKLVREQSRESAIDNITIADKILRVMESISHKPRDTPNCPRPNAETYNYVIKLYMMKHDTAAARSVLERMEISYVEGRAPEAKPTARSYFLVHDLHSAIANDRIPASILKSGGYRAESRLWQTPYPTTDDFNAVIVSYVKTAGLEGTKRAETLLVIMGELFRLGYEELKPSTKTFNMLLDGWARSKAPERRSRADQIFGLMEEIARDGGIRPDEYTYNSLIMAYGLSGSDDSLSMVENIFRKMQSGNNPIRPNKFIFTSLINVCSKSKEQGAAKRAQEFLNIMVEMFENGDAEMKPDTIVYNGVLTALAHKGGNSDNFEERSIELVSQMEEAHAKGDDERKPDMITYSLLLRSLARGKGDHRSIAERYLAKMNDISDKSRGDVRRQLRHAYNSVITITQRISHKSTPEKCEGYLRQMEHGHASGMNDIKPNVFTYCKVIDAWSKSSHPERLERANALLVELENKYALSNDSELRPDVAAYTSVLNTCATTTGTEREKGHALKIALQIYKRITSPASPVTPDSAVYAVMLNVCTHLFDEKNPSQAKLVRSIFTECCRDGQVNNHVLNMFRRAVPLGLFQKMLGCKGNNWDNKALPKEWSRNAAANKPQRRR